MTKLTSLRKLTNLIYLKRSNRKKSQNQKICQIFEIFPKIQIRFKIFVINYHIWLPQFHRYSSARWKVAIVSVIVGMLRLQKKLIINIRSTILVSVLSTITVCNRILLNRRDSYSQKDKLINHIHTPSWIYW